MPGHQSHDSLVWINFDRHALMNLFNKARGKFVADVDEIRPQYQDSNLSDGAAIFNSSLVRSVGPSIGATIDQLDALTLTEVGSLNELATPWYADQVLPFDITLAGANEYGAMTAAKIFGRPGDIVLCATTKPAHARAKRRPT
jgi:hypothetical protein